MRSLLFVPGNSAKMLAKSASSGADVVIFDLEDAVHPDAKAQARELTARTVRDASRDGPQIYVRVNSLDSAWCHADVEAIVPARPHGIMLPKLTGPHDLDRLDALLSLHESADAKGATRIIAVCTETPAATLSLAAAPWVRPRLAGLLWGGEDLSAEIGASANRDAGGAYTAPFQLARSLCLLAARAAGVVPIDAVFTNFRDSEGLTKEAAAARRDGFSAKAAIHPNQIATINAAFTPTEAERAWALRVIAALEQSRSGVTQIDGMMIDAPHLAQARRILGVTEKSGG
jgi:citrate lyase subunit beta/citryl-CoA lyase